MSLLHYDLYFLFSLVDSGLIEKCLSELKTPNTLPGDREDITSQVRVAVWGFGGGFQLDAIMTHQWKRWIGAVPCRCCCSERLFKGSHVGVDEILPLRNFTSLHSKYAFVSAGKKISFSKNLLFCFHFHFVFSLDKIASVHLVWVVPTWQQWETLRSQTDCSWSPVSCHYCVEVTSLLTADGISYQANGLL